MTEVSLVKLPPDECNWTLLMISQQQILNFPPCLNITSPNGNLLDLGIGLVVIHAY